MILLIAISLVWLSNCNGNNPFRRICNDDQRILEVVAGEGGGANIPFGNHSNITNFKNFTTALSHAGNNTCIVFVNVTSDQWAGSTNFTNIHDFTIGSITTTTIRCHGSTGLSFIQSEKVKFFNLSFQTCGASRRIKNYHQIDVNINSTLFFKHVRDIYLSNMHIFDHNGLAITFIDCASTVSIQYVNIQNTKDFNSSGIFIKYTGDDHYSSNNKIFVENSSFQNLKSMVSKNVHSEDYPFGTGAFCVIFESSGCYNNSIAVSSSRYLNNKGSLGGAVFIRLAGDSNYNEVSFTEKTEFTENQADKYGGAICIISKTTAKDNNNAIILNHVSFKDNAGKKGGGIFSWYSTRVSRTNVILSGCSFDNNTATTGSDLLGVHTTFKFTAPESVFKGNTYEKDQKYVKPYGCISLYGSNLDIHTDISVSNSLNTGIVLVSSNATIAGNYQLLLSMNHGENGGGIAMFTDSKIIVHSNARLTFFANSAESKGGGLYVSTIPVEFQLEMGFLSNCFITSHNDSKIEFIKNTAYTNSGSAIHTSSLRGCVTGHSTKDLKNVFNNLIFLGPEQSITTDPVNITINEKEWEIEPGKIFKPNIILTDERGNLTTSTIDIVVQNDSCPKGVVNIVHKRTVVVNKTADISFTGDVTVKCTFNIALISSQLVSRLIQNRFIANCSKFYDFDKEKKRCVCDPKQYWESYISQCFQNQVYVYLNYWIHKIESIRCPQQYCKEYKEGETNNGRDILFDQDKQCNQNRDQRSVLCSKCEQGFAVSIIDNRCINCTDAQFDWKLYILGNVILYTVVNLVIIILNREVYAGYINPVIYSYKLLEYFLDDIRLPAEPVTLFIQKTLFPSLCFTKTLNNLDKLWASFGLSPLPLFLYLLMYWLFYEKRICACAKFIPRSRDAYYRSLTSIIFLVYFRVVDFAFRALHYTFIDGEYKIYHYADEIWWSTTNHKAMVVIASICLIFLLLYDISLFFNSTSVQTKFGCALVFSSTVQPIMMALKVGYKTSPTLSEDRTWFAPIYLVIFTLYMAVGEFYLESARSCFLTLAGLLLLVLFIYFQPYKSKSANKIETILLSNIVIVGILIDGVSGMFIYSNGFKFVVCVCCYIPGVCLVGCVLYSLKKFLPPFDTKWSGVVGSFCSGRNVNLQTDQVAIAPPPFFGQRKKSKI